MKEYIIPCLCFLLCISSGCAEKRTKEVWYAERFDFQPPTYVCYKTPHPIVIDGKMSPGEWDAIPWTADFIDIEGSGQPYPYLQTHVKMAHDEKGMYFAAWMEEPHVWANLTEHDAVIYYDNDFELFLDPSGDTHNYLEYEVNALGTVWDLFLDKPYRDNGIPLNNWEFNGMKSAVHVDGTINDPADTDRSWSVEVFIPWSDIFQVVRGGKAPAEGDQIRVNFSRVQWTTEAENGEYIKIPMEGETRIREHNWVWAPTGVINIHMPEYWGYVQFTHKEAGTEEVAFAWNPEEDVKFLLRQLYYRQREYHQAFNAYSSHLPDLKPEELCSPEQLKRLDLHATLTQYEISYTLDDASVWYIRQDGYVWKTTKPDPEKIYSR